MQSEALRDVFGKELLALGHDNDKIVVLDADLSSTTRSAFFGDVFPDRFFNMGIAEANMVSVAAGLSTCGYIPYVATFGFLLALRATDQIRSQLCYPRLNVKLIGSNAGLTGHGDGATHQTTNDLAILGSIPNMKLLVPSDDITLRWAIREAAEIDGPVYVRVPRVAAERCHSEDDTFEFGKGIVHREGTDLTIVTMGLMLEQSLKAADTLEKEGISASVVEILTLKPFDKELIVGQAKKTGALVTVEEHNLFGGLFSLTAEAVSETNPVPVTHIAVEDRFGETGSYSEILDSCGLTTEHIVEQAKKAVALK